MPVTQEEEAAGSLLMGHYEDARLNPNHRDNTTNNNNNSALLSAEHANQTTRPAHIPSSNNNNSKHPFEHQSAAPSTRSTKMLTLPHD